MTNRGDITLWISQDALDAWMAPKSGQRGAQPIYADIAIETALALRLLFRLPLRQAEGLLGSVWKLMGLALPCPDYTTLSRRNATFESRRCVSRATPGPVDVIVDRTGLKVCGQGEWRTQQHGEKKQKRWKKLHIGADGEGQIIASTVTESHGQDPSQVPALISQVERGIACFISDGIDDQAPVYAAVETHAPGAQGIIPPRKDAVLRPSAMTTPRPRDQHLWVIEHEGRFAWKLSIVKHAYYPLGGLGGGASLSAEVRGHAIERCQTTNQFLNACAIAPLVIIPGDDFDEGLIHDLG
jgi:hypothetical protein